MLWRGYYNNPNLINLKRQIYHVKQDEGLLQVRLILLVDNYNNPNLIVLKRQIHHVEQDDGLLQVVRLILLVDS